MVTWWKQGSHIQWCLKKAQSSRSCWKRELFVWEIHCCIHPKGTEIWEEMCYHFYVKNWECVKGSKLVCLHFLISWIHSQFLRRIRNKAHPKHYHTKETILKDYVLISLLLKSMVEIEFSNFFNPIEISSPRQLFNKLATVEAL